MAAHTLYRCENKPRTKGSPAPSDEHFLLAISNQVPCFALCVLRRTAHVLAARCLLCLHTQVAVSEVEGGAEPPFFTQHFPGWDARPRPSIVDVYAEKLRSLGL